MLTTLKKSTTHLFVFLFLATVHVNCTKKQIATAVNTNSTNTTSTDTTASSEGAMDATDLQKYTGRYDIKSGDISWAEITVENNKLYGKSSGQPKTELINESGDKFRVQGLDATVTFTRDGQKITGLVISYQGNELKGEKVN
jgi:hypothetical protein